MKLFSKRYNSRDIAKLQRIYSAIGRSNRPEFLDSSLRIRLSQEISYIVSRGEFTEPFLLSRFGLDNKFFLNVNALQLLSYHELGYDITDYYSCEDLIPKRIKTEDFGDSYFDKYIIDLVELLIIFSLNDKQSNVISRFQKILKEENSDLLIYGYMIVIQDAGGLQSISNLISDNTLREKLEDILIKRVETTIAAREAADITQRVYSGSKKEKTKKHTEGIIDKIAKRWIEPKDHQNFKDLMNNLVKNVKGLNNELANIRHTDKSTIDFGSPDIFKMIRNLNLAISEMAILSTQDEFIENESAISLKTNYMKTYNIDNKISQKSKQVDLDEIPF